jgi:hypothetical protein
MTDTELKLKGFELLRGSLGMVELEKFISLIQLEKFDYTKWRQNLFSDLSGDEISKMAMKNRLKNT